MTDRRWIPPPGKTASDLYLWAQNWARLFQRGLHKDYKISSVTLSAGTSTVVSNDYVTDEASILLTPTNAAAAALSPYISARAEGVSFTLTHATAGGTETYTAIVIR